MNFFIQALLRTFQSLVDILTQFKNNCETYTCYKYDENKMRSHIIDCIKGGKWIVFPRKVRTRGQSHNILSYEWKATCRCGAPDWVYDDMIKCDNCTNWDHIKCAGVENSESDFL